MKINRKKTIILSSLFIVISACSLITYGFLNGFFSPTPHLTVVGFSCINDGIGSHPASIIEATINHVDVNYIGKKDNPSALASNGVSEKTQKVLTEKAKRQKIGKFVFYVDTISALSPRNHKEFYRNLKSKIKNPHKREDQIWVAFSVWESSKIPYAWVEILNANFDAVVVPDESLIHVYESSGVNKPIFVSELPVNLNPFLNLPLKKERSERFIFTNLASYQDRKNQLTLVKAFSRVFKNNPDVYLYMNGRYSFDDYHQKVIDEIEKEGIHNICAHVGPLPNIEYLNQLLNTDCLVNISKGEGFSIQPREAMAMGLPCVLSDNTAQSTICKHKIVAPVACNDKNLYFRVMVNGEGMSFDGFNYECSEEDLANKLKHVYENYGAYLKQSQSARDWTKQYLPSNLSWKYLSLVNPKHIKLGEHNRITKDGIETNSQELFDKYQKLAN